MDSNIKNILNTIESINNNRSENLSPKIIKNSNKDKKQINQKIKSAKPKKLKQNKIISSTILTKEVKNPLWLSVSQAAAIGGVNNKTIRRAIQNRLISYKIVNNRYILDFKSLITYLYSNTKLKNKLNLQGIGQYIVKWRE